MHPHEEPAALSFDERTATLRLLDQTRLPGEERWLACRTPDDVVDAIRRLAVRGAPLLGLAGAYAVVLAVAPERAGARPRASSSARAAADERLRAVAARVAAARPTAVNLGWAVRRVLAAVEAAPGSAFDAALAAAREIQRADAQAAADIARHGLPLVPPGAAILTHCNTGRLVSAGAGTAFGIVAAAHRAGLLRHLWVDETRPLLQGARLTAYEAARAGIPYTVLADAAAGSLFAAGQVDLVVVGADRVAADGSVANKVGTYPLAVLARQHGVPFVVAAPTSTIDPRARDGADIPVEQRDADEVLCLGGVRVAPPGAAAYNPAFDVTPAGLVSALVTEAGIARPVDAQTVSRLLPSAAPAVAP